MEMTGKLIKYEMRSSIKLMAVIWAALIAASLLFSLSIHVLGDMFFDDGEQKLNVLVGIVELVTGLMYAAVFAVLVVTTLVIVVMRFYRGLLGDEGYLMHTLPVKPWQLITSKGVVAAGVVLVSMIVAFLYILALAGANGFKVVPEMFRSVGAFLDKDPWYILFFVEGVILILLSLLKSIYQIYASLAIGQLANKHRVLLALGAYIGLNLVITILSAIVMVAAENLGISQWLNTVISGGADNVFRAGQIGAGILFLLTAVQLVGFHVITERILSLKLNLQ